VAVVNYVYTLGGISVSWREHTFRLLFSDFVKLDFVCASVRGWGIMANCIGLLIQLCLLVFVDVSMIVGWDMDTGYLGGVME